MEKIYNLFIFLETNAFNWVALKRLGNNRIVRSSQIWFFMIPIIVKFLSKINFPIEVNIELLSIDFVLNITLPFSWKLFYFSAVFFALGTFLYSIFCPHIVKYYADFDDFIKQEQSGIKLYNYFSNLTFPKTNNRWNKRLLVKFQCLVHFIDNYTDIKITDEGKVQLSKNPPNYSILHKITIIHIHDSDLAAAFAYTIRIARKTNLFIRTICAISFLAGVIAILIVFSQNVWTVIDFCRTSAN